MASANELHVIFGSGPVGTAVVELLLAQGKRVRVVTRSGARKHLPAQAEVMRGDATDTADIRRLTVGATHVYNATNPVDYHRWPEQFPPLQRGVLTAAGMAVGLAGGVALLGIDTAGATLPLRGLVTGAGIGLAQYLVLRGMIPRAFIWAVVVTLGWAVGWMVTRAAGINLAPNFTVFGSTGA